MKSLFALAALSMVYGFPTPDSNAAQAKTDYIVVLKPLPQPKNIHKRFTNTILNTLETYQDYESAHFNGFAASLTAGQVQALKREPEVAYIEEDGFMHTHEVSKGPVTQQSNSTWGLARISHREKTTFDYIYDNSAGAGTCAYIIDTGLMAAHPEFEGRATFVKNYDIWDKTDLDMHGHGTHVAGTIGSKSYGVSKKTKLFGIKVCNITGNCAVSAVVNGVLMAITDSAQRSCPNGVVVNISLGSKDKEWQSVKDVIKKATDAGLFIAISAGNSNEDTTPWMPANAPSACTVGAIDQDDSRAVFSNYGTPVRVFAPGVDIMSTYSSNGTVDTVRLPFSIKLTWNSNNHLGIHVRNIYGEPSYRRPCSLPFGQGWKDCS